MYFYLWDGCGFFLSRRDHFMVMMVCIIIAAIRDSI